MRAVVQRVTGASVEVDGKIVAEIARGLLVLVGLEEPDGDADLAWMAEKLAHLRIFPDDAGKMNRSALDLGLAILLVPNFTLAGDARTGRRPGFDNAMKPERAGPEFERLAAGLRSKGVEVKAGIFRAHMSVSLVNDGPVTIWLDSRA